MQLVLVTVLALGATPASTASRQPAAPPQPIPAQAPEYAGVAPGECCEDEACGCRGGLMGAGLGSGNFAHNLALRAAMPQTCYAPRYGCYHGSERFMNRYPAFHGTYYRRPYNYRNYFDYPWHAEMHEPTSLFSFNVANEERDDAERVPPMARRAPQAAAPSRPVPVPQNTKRPIADPAPKSAAAPIVQPGYELTPVANVDVATPPAPPAPGAVRAVTFSPGSIEPAPTLAPVIEGRSNRGQPTLAPVTSRSHQASLAPVVAPVQVTPRAEYLSRSPATR